MHRVVLVRPMQSGNVGSVCRVMANFGFDDLVLVEPRGFDPDRARWMAPGAAELVDSAAIVGSVAEAVQGCTVVLGTTTRDRRWHRPQLNPESAALRLLDAAPTAAILFGPEDAGLSNQDLLPCEAVVTIPTASLESLNLSHAVAVVLRAILEEARSRGQAPGAQRRQVSRGGHKHNPKAAPTPEELASVEARTALVQEALSVLESCDYMRGRSEEQVHVTLFGLLARTSPTQRELNMLRGMLAKLQYHVTRR